MKLTKAKLQQIIKEEIDAVNEEKMIKLSLSPEEVDALRIALVPSTELSLTQKKANDLLIALEAVEQTPEIKALYDKIFDAGLAKARLKQIIKEEVEAVLGDDADLMDELFPGESLMQEELTILSIALGSALGLLAYKSLGPLARMAGKILLAGGEAVEAMAMGKLQQIEAEIGEPMVRDAIEIMEADERLPVLVAEYHDLVDQVEKAKGKRGPEFAAMRKRRKEVSKELTEHIQMLMNKIQDARDPDAVEKMAKASRALRPNRRLTGLEDFDQDLQRKMRRRR
jgi:hypothetical protein